MKIIKKIYGRIEYIIYFYISLLKILIYSKKKCKKIYLMGIPIHGNLGDQAIVIAERQFLNDNFKNYKIIEIESSIILRKISFLKKHIDDSLILIHGGGFIGTIWPKEDKMAKIIIEEFDNNIIFLPQTAFFDNNSIGLELLNQNKNIYEKKKNLHICLREKYSYDFMKKNFEKCNLYIIPDMVLYMKNNDYYNSEKPDRITICLRNDKEKTLLNSDYIKRNLKEEGLNNLYFTDTVINRRLYYYNRVKFVNKKIKEFLNSKIVITDRLHGMIFAYLANTPCIVINSKSYKVKGVYNWIENNKTIVFTNNEGEFKNTVKKFRNIKIEINKKENYKEKFNELSDLIKNNL